MICKEYIIPDVQSVIYYIKIYILIYQEDFNIILLILSWSESLDFSISATEKPEQTFWPTQYIYRQRFSHLTQRF